MIEPQLGAFYDQLMDFTDAQRTTEDGPQPGRPTAAVARRRPAALAAPTGVLHDANPRPHCPGSGFA